MSESLTLEEFAKLREHLALLDEIFSRFCSEYHFVEAHENLGRYPRRRVDRYGRVNLCFDLDMDLDDKNDYFREFRPELPYSLGGGAQMDIGTTRYSRGIILFQRKPFSEIPGILMDVLRLGYDQIKDWDESYLQREGERSKIAFASPNI